jgi:spermidine synthase
VLWSNDIRGEGYDAVLFGWANPTQINVDQVQAFLDDPRHAAVKQSLADVDMNSAVDLFQTYAGDARRLQPWLADAEINYDRNLRLQYLAGLWLNSYMGADILSGPQDSILKYYKFPNDIFVGSGPALDQLKTALAAEGRAKYTLPPPILPPRAGNAPAAP